MTGWKRTHCIHGHEWTPENTCVDPRGKRRCRACTRASYLRNIERRRAAARLRRANPEARARINAIARERYAANPAPRPRDRTPSLARRRERYATDPEFRERSKAYTRAYYASDPAHRERAKELARARYANDPEYREREKARSLANARAARPNP
jgi:hypothetical protein